MISDLFRQMEELLEPSGGPPMDGWCTRERAADLMSLVIGLRPRVCIELGVWAGKSTLPIALALRHLGRGTIMAIDPWSAEASREGQQGADLAWWDDQAKHDLVLGRFKEKISELDLHNYIQVVRRRSDDVEPPVGIDLLLIDANHGDGAIRDTERFAAKVTVGGIVYMDDIGWTGGAVAKAVALLGALGFTELYKRDTGAFFQRIK